MFLSSKGGAGKTTTALTLALGLAARHSRVSVIDTDPNLPLYRWGSSPRKPQGVMVFPAASPELLQDALPVARAWAEWTVIDTEGSTRARQLVGLSRADMILIPVGASPLEALEAIRTSRALRELAAALNRPIPHACIFSRLPAAIRARSFGEVVKQLQGEGVTILKTPLIEKEAFRAVFNYGGDLESLDSELVSGIAAAKANMTALTDNIIGMMAANAVVKPAPAPFSAPNYAHASSGRGCLPTAA
jgi:chromosome partitioning protein